MPRVTLEFKLPEEQEEFDTARNGIAYVCVLNELDSWLRGFLKYECPKSLDAHTLLTVRHKLHEFLGAHNVQM